MGAERSFSGGRFMLNIDGTPTGMVKSVSGGITKGHVVTHDSGSDNKQTKHLATIEHTDITINVGMGMGKGLYEWIRASFDKGHITKSGEIHACDFDYNSMAIRSFSDAHISKVTVPALDGSSKEAGYLTVVVKPEQIRYAKGTGSQIAPSLGTKTKKWLTSNFKFELGGLPCNRVAKIDSFTWEQAVIRDEVGMFREPTLHPAKVTVPNLTLYISMADYWDWAEWHRTFVIEGKCTDGDELTGSITLLGPDMKEELGIIELDHVGIISLEQESAEANSEKVQRFKVELYMEGMKLMDAKEVDA